MINSPLTIRVLNYNIRSNATTSALSMPRTPSQLSHMVGIAMTKACSIMGSRKVDRNQPIHTGRAIIPPSIHSYLLGSLVAVNSLKSPPKVSMIHGSMAKTCMVFTMICLAFYLRMWPTK